MADLIERLTFNEEHTGKYKIPGHSFHYYMNLYALGLVSKVGFATKFNLEGDEVTQANLIADEIDARTDPCQKSIYVHRIQTVAGLLNVGDERYSIDYIEGTINKELVSSDLLIS